MLLAGLPFPELKQHPVTGSDSFKIQNCWQEGKSWRGAIWTDG
jgi:hypothetical protein